MYNSIRFVSTGAALFALVGSAWAADPPAAPAPAMHHAATAEGAKSPPTDDELIASAMKAAPKAIAEKATIVVPDSKGGMRTLRSGTNGFHLHAGQPRNAGP